MQLVRHNSICVVTSLKRSSKSFWMTIHWQSFRGVRSMRMPVGCWWLAFHTICFSTSRWLSSASARLKSSDGNSRRSYARLSMFLPSFIMSEKCWLLSSKIHPQWCLKSYQHWLSSFTKDTSLLTISVDFHLPSIGWTRCRRKNYCVVQSVRHEVPIDWLLKVQPEKCWPDIFRTESWADVGNGIS